MREWWNDPRIPISPVNRLRLAWITILITLIGWPLSAVWIGFEPQEEKLAEQFILALSWLAITLTALDVLMTADVRAEQDD
jgi:hypothetical protein